LLHSRGSKERNHLQITYCQTNQRCYGVVPCSAASLYSSRDFLATYKFILKALAKVVQLSQVRTDTFTLSLSAASSRDANSSSPCRQRICDESIAFGLGHVANPCRCPQLHKLLSFLVSTSYIHWPNSCHPTSLHNVHCSQ
jgi:hypothetical protein